MVIELNSIKILEKKILGQIYLSIFNTCKTWRQTRVVKVKRKIYLKLKDKGVAYLFIQYTNKYKENCYCILDFKDNYIYEIK